MNVLSINFGHDASLAWMREGTLVAYRELERVTRLKHQVGVHSDDIARFLAAADLAAIDAVAVTSTQFWGAYHSPDMEIAYGWTQAHQRLMENRPGAWAQSAFTAMLNTNLDPYYQHHVQSRGLTGTKLPERTKFSPVYIHGCPQDGAQMDLMVDQVGRTTGLIESNPAAFNDMLAEFLTPMSLTLKGRTIPGFHIAHHYAHACYAHLYAATEESLICSHDGGLAGAPFNSGGVYLSGGNKVIPLLSPKLFLGHIYDQASLRAGFNESDGPGKLMGLAPYGFPSRGIDSLIEDVKRMHNPYLTVEKKELDLVVDRLVFLSRADQNIRRGALAGFTFDFADRDFSIALAANTQRLAERVFESTMSPILSRLREIFPNAGSIALTGGFTLNCPANTLLQNGQGACLITPLPGAIDSGLAIGAAVAVAILSGEKPVRTVTTTGSAAAFPTGSGDSSHALQDDRLELVQPHSPLPEFMAAEIAAGKIICLVRGASEIGPRALGHRSILAKASSAAMRDRINALKGRENWRPLAPIVRAQDFARYFHGNPDSCRFMLFTYPVISREIPGVTHVDGTARVQTIGEDDALLSGVLAALDESGEPAVIVNTSFNTAGEPIVETAAQAANSFIKLGADWLIVDNQVFCRKS